MTVLLWINFIRSNWTECFKSSNLIKKVESCKYIWYEWWIRSGLGREKGMS